jgi:benzil reductase ((S)-benzoin forming)
MKYIFITGSSKGLGKALADLFLQQKNIRVVGFARSCSIEHKNYSHNTLDFSNSEALNAFNFPDLADAEEVILINNAGMLDPIKKIGTYTAEAVSMNVQVNLTAPMVLSNKFVGAYQQLDCKKLILNISSGAGKYPIDGWSAYCATKSGLDMFSTVMHAEQNLLSNVSSRIKVVALSPGIIDTEMQAEIRSSNAEDFSQVDRFVDYKNSGELQSSLQTAEKIISKLHSFYNREEVICSLREE